MSTKFLDSYGIEDALRSRTEARNGEIVLPNNQFDGFLESVYERLTESAERFDAVELLHIWQNDPLGTWAGDTLSGGESTKQLLRLGLIKPQAHEQMAKYHLTERGRCVVDKIMGHLARTRFAVNTHFVVL